MQQQLYKKWIDQYQEQYQKQYQDYYELAQFTLGKYEQMIYFAYRLQKQGQCLSQIERFSSLKIYAYQIPKFLERLKTRIKYASLLRKQVFCNPCSKDYQLSFESFVDTKEKTKTYDLEECQAIVNNTLD